MLTRALVMASLAAGLVSLAEADQLAAQRPVRIVTSDKESAPGHLPSDLQKRVNEAVDRGVLYLRRNQESTGSFGDGVAVKNAVGGRQTWAVGFAALPALALLECGASPSDPAVKKATHFVRESVPTLNRTYEISLAILLLHRIGEAGDRPRIRSLAFRLAAGQTQLGGWGYNCPVLTPGQEKKFEEASVKQKVDRKAKPFKLPTPKVASEPADNSNTQFAILGLWTARGYKVPLDYTFAQTERRFRSSQRQDGWDYRLLSGAGKGYGSMTCVGLLGLTVGHGSAREVPAAVETEESLRPEDPAIAAGLLALIEHMKDSSDMRGLGGTPSAGPKGLLNLYFLWSVERVGVLCNLKTIGGKDWYRWGADLLLTAQKEDGSWLGRGNGGISPVIDTSMALLFLKRSDLLPGLRETLQKRLTITDPGISPGEKGQNPTKQPELKKRIEKTGV